MKENTVTGLDKKMIVRYTGESDPFRLISGKEYDVINIERGWYRIIDEEGVHDYDSIPGYLYPPDKFEIISGSPDDYKDMDKVAYNRIYSYVSDMDVLNLISNGAPPDEYRPEAEKIYDWCKNHKESSKEELAEAMRRIFSESFSEKFQVSEFLECAGKIVNAR